MSSNNLSLLVRNQLPAYVREDYDTFTTFIEAYYEFLERGNNAVEVAKSFPAHMDLDTTTEQFMDYFIKEFLPLFPPDLVSNPRLLIAHAKEFYRSKGTEKSFKLLFRLLYGQEADFFYPRDHILKASDGQWKRNTSLIVDAYLYTVHYGDGETTRFRALCNAREFAAQGVAGYNDQMYILTGGTVTDEASGDDSYEWGVDFQHANNEPWVTFTTAPAANLLIKIEYYVPSFIDKFNNNEITLSLEGYTSNATAIVESMSALTHLDPPMLDVIVSRPRGNFSLGEKVHGHWVYDKVTGDYVDIHFGLSSSPVEIQVVNGGANYNVGDPVFVTGGNPEPPSLSTTAVVLSVLTAVITNIHVANGGAGYQAGQQAYITSTPNTGLNVFIASVDTTGTIHPNSYPIVTDVLNLWSTQVMSDPNFFFAPALLENSVSQMYQAFTTITFGESGPERLGPISNISIVSSTTSFDVAPTLKIDAPIAIVTGNTANGNTQVANVSIGYFGILGRMEVVGGGIGYIPGDEISFANKLGTGIGVGGAAEVTEVHAANSGIKSVRFQPSRVTGNVTVNTVVSSFEVTGIGTSFTTELNVPDRIEINNESSYISSISNDTVLIVNTAFSKSSTLRRMGVYNRYFVGGINYSMNAIPTVRVSSANAGATGANIRVTAVISGGQTLVPTGNNTPGQITAIRILRPGYGYTTAPSINLTGSGNGLANAVAIMINNAITSPGYYQSTRGFLSADQKLQGAGYYYGKYSYVIRSQTALSKYRAILKDLIHPAGTRLWGEYVIESTINTGSVSANVANTIQVPV